MEEYCNTRKITGEIWMTWTEKLCKSLIYEHIYMNYRDTLNILSVLSTYPIDQLLKFHQYIYVWIFKNLRFTSFDFKSVKHGALTSQGFHRLEIKEMLYILFAESTFPFFELKNEMRQWRWCKVHRNIFYHPRKLSHRSRADCRT